MNIFYFFIGLFIKDKYKDVWISCCGICGSKNNLVKFYLNKHRKTRCTHCFNSMEYKNLSHYEPFYKII